MARLVPQPRRLKVADLATMLAQRDALKAARYAGTLSVEVGQKKVTYRSDRELANAIAALTKEINDASGVSAPRVIRIASSKGLDT